MIFLVRLHQLDRRNGQSGRIDAVAV